MKQHSIKQIWTVAMAGLAWVLASCGSTLEDSPVASPAQGGGGCQLTPSCTTPPPPIPFLAGLLDTTFGTGGKLLTDLGSSEDRAQATLVQPDGKVLVAGYSQQATTDFALIRYLPSGLLDPNFATGGKKLTDFASSFDQAHAMALQSDGKIVLAGISNSRFALARYHTTGAPDTSFDGDPTMPGYPGNGKITTDIPGYNYVGGSSVLIQGDGKIVVGGGGDSVGPFMLVRYNPNGTLDTAFGKGGRMTTPIGAFANIRALALQAGKIVAVGNTWNGSNNDLALARYTQGGMLDPTFGSGGVVTTAIGPSHDYAFAVVVQGDKLVVGGNVHYPTHIDMLLARYTDSGQLDTSFGSAGTGIVLSSFSATSTETTYALVQQANGKLVAAGFTNPAGGAYGFGSFALARYSAAGVMDTSFGNNGLVSTGFTAGGAPALAYARAVAIGPDGKIVAAGTALSSTGYTSNYDFALARYHP